MLFITCAEHLYWGIMQRGIFLTAPPFFLFFFCVMFLLCYQGYMNIFAKQLCSHFSYTAAFRSAHAYCCNSNSLITAAINLICLKFLLFIYFFFWQASAFEHHADVILYSHKNNMFGYSLFLIIIVNQLYIMRSSCWIILIDKYSLTMNISYLGYNFIGT